MSKISVDKFVIPSTGIETVIAGFKNKKLIKSYPNVHEYTKLRDQILWVLWIIEEKFSAVGYVPPEWISEILVESLRIDSNPNTVKKALATIKKKAHPKKIEEQTFYRIMEKGIQHLKDISDDDKTIVYRIGGSTPRRDKQFLADVMKNTSGEIKIIDPYYGSKSLNNLEKFASNKSIKLLSVDLDRNEKPHVFASDLRDFKKDYKKFELRLFPNNPKELHDRYILTKDSVIFVGHGIKDLGGKESFILVFQGNTGKNILNDLDKKFVERWNNSIPI